MGNDASGIILTAEPQWERLDDFPAEYGFRGYAHKTEPIWVLGCWRGRPSSDWPFEMWDIPSGKEDLTAPQIEKLRQLKEVHDEIYGADWAACAHHLAKLFDQPVFVFTADDEFVDFACLADGKAICSLAMRVDSYHIIRLKGDGFTIVHEYEPEIMDETEWDKETLNELSALDFVQILPPRPIEENFYCQFGLELWPAPSIDPVKVARIGDYPLGNIDDDFTVVYERPGPEEKPRPKTSSAEKKLSFFSYLKIFWKRYMVWPNSGTCRKCGKPLRTRRAKQCFHCGENWR